MVPSGRSAAARGGAREASPGLRPRRQGSIPEVPRKLEAAEADLNEKLGAARAGLGELKRRRQHLEAELGVDDLAARLAEHCLVAVNGTEIGHLDGWETELLPGAIVSIVPAMVGG